MGHKKNNDKDFLSIVYKENMLGLYRYGCRFTRDQGLVMDCIHDVFLKLCEKEDISAISNIKFYLMRSIKNILLDKLAQKTIENLYEKSYKFLYERSLEEIFVEMEEQQRISSYFNQALNILTPRQKKLIQLYYLDQRSYDEICKLLGISYQSAKNIIYQALKRMRKKMIHVENHIYPMF